MIMKNFQRHYQTNRAPFGLFYHPAWFTTPHHKEGFELFLDTVTEMEDVWLVTSWQAVQWMRDPTPLDKIMDFKPFHCDYKTRPPRCDKPKVCNLSTSINKNSSLESPAVSCIKKELRKNWCF